MGTPVDDQIANLIIAQMLFLEAEDPEKDISIYINSPGGFDHGGPRHSGYHAIREAEYVTICVGQAASDGGCAAGGGNQGKRFQPAQFAHHDHQPLHAKALAGQATEIDIYAREILRMRETLNGLLPKRPVSRSSAWRETWIATTS